MEKISYKSKINNLIEKAKIRANQPIAEKILGLISATESIFFPIPVDPFLGALTLAAPQKFIKFAVICTIFSVLGGLIGWLIGYLIGPSIENFLVNIPWFSEEKFTAVKSAYKNNGMLIIFLGAFTPLPYKIITLTSGIAEVNVFAFIMMSLFGRGIRFFIVAFSVKYFGQSALLYLKNNIFISTAILGIAIITVCFYIL
jgi:membrane protein YqaA with SNARE-associated domain